MRYDDASQAGSMANDHTPVARPDADALPAGSYGPASGNVITGAGTTTGSSGEDTVGDGPGHIVALQGAGGAAGNAGGSFQATGQFGVLSLDAEGNFNYARNGGTPDGVQDVFNYTLADRDGERSSTTLTIDIGKSGSQQATVTPGVAPVIPGVVNLPAGVQMSDIHVVGRDLVINMPDGTQMVIPGGAVFVPQLVIGDTQVPASNLAAVLVGSEPQPAAGELQSSGGNFATDVPPLDPGIPLGDLIPPTEFGFTPPEFEEIGQFVDLKPAAGAVSVQLDDDDIPGKNGNAGGVGDDSGSPNATASGQLPGSGGDQPISWDLLTTGAPAGFSYVDGPNGSILVQQVQNGSTVTVLTITIDPATGAFTVTENAPIIHATGDNENNAVFVINYNVVDTDGDVAPGTLTVNVDDDTPTVNVQAGPDAAVLLTTDDAQSIPGDGDPDTAVTTANFSGVFSGTTVSSGADGAGPSSGTTYALAVTGSSSGLTSHGAAINLFVVNGTVVGTTAGSAGAIDAGNTIFTVSTTNTGIVTLTQFQQIDHPIGQDPSATGTPFSDQLISLADGLVTLTRSETVVDNDGDSVTGSASVNIGANLQFTDDGPTIGLADRGEATLSVDESNFAVNDTQSFAANFSADFGADGPAAAGGGLTYALGINAGATGLIDTLSGQPVVLSVVNGQVVGTAGIGGPTVFTVSVDASGNVTLDQSRAVIHSPDSGPDQTTGLAADNLVTLTATATDFDGDTASQTLNLGLNLTFHDDAPSATATLLTGTVDEDGVPGGIPGGTGDVPGENTVATGDVSTLFNSGADQPLTFSLLSDTSGLPQTLTSSGVAVTYSVNGNTLTASAGANTVFTFTVNADGSYTFTLLDQLDHAPGNDENDLTIALGSIIQATDADGDSVTANANGLVITVDDDTPVARNDSDTLPSGSNGPETGNVITGTGTAGGTGGVGADSSGADAPATITAIAGAGGADSTFTAGLLSVTGDHGTLTIDANGNYSYTRTDNVAGSLQDVFTYTLTDADGDSTTATLTLNLSDNVPTLPEPALVQLDDDALAGGNPGGTGDDPDSAGLPGQLNGTGGDGTLTYSFTGNNTLPAGFTVNPVNATTVQILQGATVVLTVTLNTATGAFNVVQNNPIDHPAGSDENNLPFSIGVQVTDADGDSDPANITINVDDDTPVAHNDTDALPSGSNGPETGNVITGVGTTSGVAGADSGGADAPATITAIAGTGGTDTTFTAGLLSIAGTHGTLTIDASGNYSYTRTDNVAGNLQDVFTYTLTDADGDSTTATLTINMSDNVPSLATPPQANLDDDVVPGLNGNPGGTGDDPPDTVGQNSVSGTLVGSGGDGDLDYFFSAAQSGLPAGFSVGAGSDADTLLIVQTQNGSPVVVLTIQLNNETGDYSVTQNAAILHPAGLNENNIPNINVSFFTQDADGDQSPPATLVINVDDDTPTIDVTAASDSAVILTTDDAQTIGVASDTATSSANFGGIFGLTSSAGADGTNSAPTLAYALGVSSQGVDSGLNQHGVDIHLYLIGGVVVGSTSTIEAGVNAGNTVFNVSVSGTGVVTLTQFSQIDHPIGSDPTPTGAPFSDQAISLADGLVTLTASSSITDRDGDPANDSATVNIGANLHFTDDGPDAATSVTAVGTVTLDETRPEGADRGPGASGPNGDASNTIDFSINFVSGASVNFGADGPGSTTYSLSLSGSNVASGLYALDGTDTSASDGDGYGQGGQIVLNLSGNTITGSFNGTNYFTIAINPATGVVTFTQLNNIWHPTAGGSSFDESATLNTALASNVQVVQTVTDFDGDTDSASINVGQGVFIIQDDGPQAIQPQDATVEDTAGQSALGVPLDDDGSLTGDFGTDLPGKITFANITNGMDTTEKSHGQTIELWLSADGQTLTGRTGSTNGTDGNLVYTVHINANGTYDFVLNDTIDNGSGVSFDDLTSSAAGNVEFRGVGADDPTTTVDLLLSGSAAGVDSPVNTDSDSIGTANQSMDAGETVRIDFVGNLTTDGVDPDTPPSGFNYGAHVSSNSFIGHIPQVQGAQTETVAFTVFALNSTNTDAAEPDRNPAGGFSDATITHITDVTVIGFDVGQSTPVTIDVSAFEGDGLFHSVAYGISVRINSDGSATFSGIQQGDQYGFNTDGGSFNAVVVEANAAGTGGSTEDSFDLGVFAIGTVNVGNPLHLAFDINITDADGDTIVLPDAINVTVNPAGSSSTLSTLSAQSSFAADSSDTSSLFANSLDTQKTSTQQTTTNSNSVLMGALAAAGLAASEPLAAQTVSDDSQLATQSGGVTGAHNEALAPIALDALSGNHGVELAGTLSEGHAEVAAASVGLHAPDSANAALDAAGSQSDAHAPAELPQGTDAPANDAGVSAAALTAGGIAMPDAALLLAAAQAHGGLAGQAPSIEGQHNEVVGKVLADALHGGGDGPNVEALLNSLPQAADHGQAAADALASHGAGAVPNGDMGIFTGFTGAGGLHMMEQMAVHADAVPAHA